MLQEKSKIETLTLASGPDRCDIIPSIGGGIGRWTVKGQSMMRPVSAASIADADAFGLASFPLVPYSNRIGNAEFEWGENPIAPARKFPPQPPSSHGVGFDRPWSVQSRSMNSAVLTLSNRSGAGWPWPFEAKQRISLSAGSLNLEMSVVNLADRPVPLAFGHHPYFPRDGATLMFRAKGVWLAGDDGLPSACVKPFDRFDYSRGMSVERGDIDHCYTGWDGSAYIDWRDQPFGLEIAASPELSNAVVCIRDEVDAFCFEPVPHAKDAVNRRATQSDMPIIDPGAAFTASIRLRAVPRE